MLGIFSDLFTLATSGDIGEITDTLSFLTDRKRIRSISSASDYLIFNFPMFISEDHTPEEMTRIQKFAETNYAVMLSSCFAAQPVITVRANETNPIAKYLDKFHQNYGTNVPGSGAASRKFIDAISYATSNLSGIKNIGEAAIADLDALAVGKHTRDLILETWSKYKDVMQESVKRLDEETYVSLNDLYNESALDPDTERALNKYSAHKKELDTWGFLGESVPSDMFAFDMASESEPIPEAEPVQKVEAEDGSDEIIQEATLTTKEGYSKLNAKLDSIPNNKIKSASNTKALKHMESKLNSMKKKYTKYLIRYKKKYEAAEQDNKKLQMTFEGKKVEDPKNFMKVYGEFMKIVNKKLALCKQRQEELSQKSAKSVSENGYGIPDKPLENCSLTELDEMTMNILDSAEFDLDYICEASDDEIFTIEEASIPKVTKNADTITLPNGKTVVMNKPLSRRGRYPSTDEIYKAAKAEADKEARNKYQPKNVEDSDEKLNRSWRGVGKASLGNRGDRMFTNMELKKANDALPTMVPVNINLQIKGSNQIVPYSFTVGVKVNLHPVSIDDCVDDIIGTYVNSRKLLKFIKLTSGEESTIKDLLLGINAAKKEVEDNRSGNMSKIYRNNIKRRKKLSKMSIPFITKNYTFNVSMAITQNIVDEVKRRSGIDISNVATTKKIMDEEFMFAFYISDQAGQVVKAIYDNDIGYNQLSYNSLDRQQADKDKEMREILRIVASSR